MNALLFLYHQVLEKKIGLIQGVVRAKRPKRLPVVRTVLPAAVKELLLRHFQAVRRQHDDDLRKGLGRVTLPNALDRKYSSAGRALPYPPPFFRHAFTGRRL